MSIRYPDFAGSWYPAGDEECLRAIRDFLEHDEAVPESGGPWRGGVVPHAGWFFSGRAAARVFSRISRAGNPPDVVIVFGGHLGPRHPHQLMADGAWRTPFGDLRVAEWLAGSLQKAYPFEVETPSRHRPDNTIELQMPFIKHFWPESEVLGIQVAARQEALDIARKAVEETKTRGRNPVFIGSTDLTHYGPNYGFTPKGCGPEAVRWVKEDNDRKAVECILALDPEALIREAQRNRNVCCPGAAAAALSAGRALGADRGALVEYYTSYDMRPDESFVGYAGAVF